MGNEKSGDIRPQKEEIWRVCLYVVRSSSKSAEALVNLENILKEYLPGRYELEIIDIIESPLKAVSDGVIAAPTLIKWTPPPVCRLVGTLQEKDKVLACLGLNK